MYILKSNFLPPINKGLSIYFEITYVSFPNGAKKKMKNKLNCVLNNLKVIKSNFTTNARPFIFWPFLDLRYFVD